MANENGGRRLHLVWILLAAGVLIIGGVFLGLAFNGSH